MCHQNDTMKPVRGKNPPLIVDPDTDPAGLHMLAVKEMTDFHSDLHIFFQNIPLLLPYCLPFSLTQCNIHAGTQLSSM